MKELYIDGAYINNVPLWHEKDSFWKASQIIKILKRNSIQPKSFCEIGCGAGEILSVLAKRYSNSNFIGFEISEHAFTMCEKKSTLNLKFQLKDITLSEDYEFYDIILAIDVLEHVEDIYGLLKTIKEKSNYKIFNIPLDLSVQSILRCSPIISLRKSVGHIHYFTKELALETLCDTGYEIIDHFYTAGSLEIKSKSLKSMMMKLPRKFSYFINKDFTVRIFGGFSLMVLAK